MGAMGYADDLALLAPSRTAMQMMLTACEEFGRKNNLVFSTDTDPAKSKTKCIFMVGKKKMKKPAPLILYGRELPWVRTANHLGNELCEDGTLDTDAKKKRASFISKSLEVREQFSFAHPVEVLTAVQLYCSDHYGSMIWDLGGNMAKQYFNAWSTCVKLAWNVSRSTHSYFLPYLSGGLVSAKRDILSRYGSFYKSLLTSPCSEIRVLARVVARDVRSTTGKNIKVVEESSGLTWKNTSLKLREGLEEAEPSVPPEDAWRVVYLGKLLEERDILVYGGEELSQEVVTLQSLIDSLCSS